MVRGWVILAATLGALWATPSAARFIDVQVLRFESVGRAQEFAEARERDPNGLSVGASTVSARGAPISREAGDFRLGEVIALCFRPVRDMVIRVVDTDPQGVTRQLFPRGAPFAQARRGVEYCIGDPASEATFVMSEESGEGVGLLWLVGADEGAGLPSVDDLDPPSFASAPSDGADAGRGVYEAWFDYRVR